MFLISLWLSVYKTDATIHKKRLYCSHNEHTISTLKTQKWPAYKSGVKIILTYLKVDGKIAESSLQ